MSGKASLKGALIISNYQFEVLLSGGDLSVAVYGWVHLCWFGS